MRLPLARVRSKSSHCTAALKYPWLFRQVRRRTRPMGPCRFGRRHRRTLEWWISTTVSQVSKSWFGRTAWIVSLEWTATRTLFNNGLFNAVSWTMQFAWREKTINPAKVSCIYDILNLFTDFDHLRRHFEGSCDHPWAWNTHHHSRGHVLART